MDKGLHVSHGPIQSAMNALDAALRNNPQYVDALYRAYREDPTSVDATWAAFFAGYDLGLADATAVAAAEAAAGPPAEAAGAEGEAAPGAAPSQGEGPVFLTALGGLPEGVDETTLAPRLRIYDLVYTYRTYGHLVADIDPLGRSPRHHPFLDLAEFGFTERDLDQEVDCDCFRGIATPTVRGYLDALRETYCGPIGVEYMDVTDKAERDWLQQQMEPIRNRPRLTAEQEADLLRSVVAADTFEETLGRMYPGAKRFSLEGGTSLVVLLQTLAENAAGQGVEQLVMGMAHRGRLNVLAHVLGKPYEYILAEFEGRPLPESVQGYGDVKYHLGYSRYHEAASGRRIHLSLEFNPSHLEAVDPVVLGICRARQNELGDAERRRVIPVLMHGDAAFTGQGVVMETFALGNLPAYRTGGTIHVIINNQVGFTTSPAEGRSTRYASDIAKGVRAPVFHVNADHPESVRLVAELALGYRQRFGHDVVIDLVCYRRHGHNELDDPSFTQPVMYKLISQRPSSSRVYAERLVAEGVIAETELSAMQRDVQARMEEAREKARVLPYQYLDSPDEFATGLKPAGADWSAVTAVSRPMLERLARALVTVPEGFHWHRRLEKLMKERAAMVLEDRPLDWGCGEALAIGSLLLEGTKVRLSGQDSGRGTFSHRHAIYTDVETGARWIPLNHVTSDQNVVQVVNSPLSEEAVLGFEYGYSIADPWTLVCWEAQFGDFVNGAQVVIDQLIASGEYKWGRRSGLVLLLPHGYEGQGPEHSSARLERFLELCAENNMQVCNLTTPAQLFHALRRQVRREFRKPLVVMSPKSLLRHPRAVSAVSDLVEGAFRPLLADDTVADRAAVKRVLLCSGKVYYALEQGRQARGASDVPILRVEQLYPFPARELAEELASYEALETVVWVQEEPRNMGAWRNLRHQLEKLPPGVALEYAGRDSRAVPATGSYQIHLEEEEALVEAAFADRGTSRLVRRTRTVPGGR